MLIPVDVADFVRDAESDDGTLMLKLTEHGGTRTFAVHVLPHDPIVHDVCVAFLKSDPTITVEPSLEVQKFIDTLRKDERKLTEVIIRQVDDYEIDEGDNADIVAQLVVRPPDGTQQIIEVLLMQGIILGLHCDAKIFVERTLFDLMSFDWGDGSQQKRGGGVCPHCGGAGDASLKDADALRRYIRSVDVLDMGYHIIKTESKTL